MASDLKTWTKDLFSITGATLAGPAGALIGSLSGGLFAALVPGASDQFGQIFNQTIHISLDRTVSKLLEHLEPVQKKSINHDLQIALRDALREAIYDLGGPHCFPQVWVEKPRQVPARYTLLFTPQEFQEQPSLSPTPFPGPTEGPPHAGQISLFLKDMLNAIAEQRLLPLSPSLKHPAASQTLLYQQAQTPQTVTEAFYIQVVQPYLQRFSTQVINLPGFDENFRRNLTDRMLVHLGEMLKTRAAAWNAYNRLVLSELRNQVHRTDPAQAEILAFLDGLMETNTTPGSETARQVKDNIALRLWTDLLADLIATAGSLETQANGGFHGVLTHLGSQPDEVDLRFKLLLVTSASEPAPGSPVAITEELPVPGVPPYKGLQAYTSADTHLFFGREKTITRLVDRLCGEIALQSKIGAGRHSQENFLAVIGKAGCGKSSLVQAGLIPALQLKMSPPTPEALQVHCLTPTAHPLHSLADSLVRRAATQAATPGTFGIPELVETMLTDEDCLRQVLSKMLYPDPAGNPQTSAQTPHPRILLVVDQFEEVFTLCSDETERKAFIDNLLTAAQRMDRRESAGATDTPEGFVGLVIVFRAEYYARCTDYENLRQAIVYSQEFIGPMSATELRRAIEEPARCNGWELESGLVSVILRDLGADEWPVSEKPPQPERRGDFLRRYPPQPGVLPSVSHTLLETWNHRRGHMMTLESYAESGGVQEAIAKTAESTFQQLDTPQKNLARKLFLQLTAQPAAPVRGEELQVVCRCIPVAELGESQADEQSPDSPDTHAPVQEVLHRFAEAGLVTLQADRAEISHEALIDQWPRLRKWQDEQIESAYLQRKIISDAREWHRNNNDPALAYRGARLAQALEWAEGNKEHVSSFEKEFLEFSGFVTEREAAARTVHSKARRQVEIETTHKQTEAANTRRQSEISRLRQEKQDGRRQFIRRGIGAGLFALTALAAILALWLAWDNRQQRLISDRLAETALQNQGSAQAASTQAYNAQITAQADAAARATAEADALSQKEAAEAARAEAERQSRNSQVLELAGLASGFASQDVDLALLLGVEAVELASTEHIAALGEAQTALFHALQVSNFSGVLRGHTDQVHSAVYSPDNQYILTTSRDQTARLWDMKAGSSILIRKYTGEITSAAFSPDGTSLLTTGADQSQDGVAELWALDGTQLGVFAGHTGQVNWGGFNPDGSLILTAGEDKTARLWQVDGSLVTILAGHTQAVTCAVFSPDRARLLTLSSAMPTEQPTDTTARLWSTDGTWVATLAAHTQPILTASFNSDGSRILTASADGTARLWLADGTPVSALQGHTKAVTSAVFSLDGQRILTASPDGTARLWRDDGSPLSILTTTSLGARFDASPWAGFSPDGTLILTAGGSSIAQLWTLDGILITTLSGHTDIIYHASFNEDGSQILTASADGTARVWNVNQLYAPILSQASQGVTWVGFSPDGNRVMTAGQDGVARLYSLEGRPGITFPGHTSGLSGASFSPDGQLIATASRDGTARIWRPDGTFMADLKGSTAPLGSISFSPDSKHVVTAGEDGTARLYRVSGSFELAFEGHTGRVNSAFFSPDGNWIVTASLDGTARVWGLEGQVQSTIYNNEIPVSMAVFSPDGQHVLTAGQDGIARLWLADGSPLASLEGHTGAVNWAAFSPDGNLIATAGLDGTVRLWTMGGEFLASATGHTQSALAVGFSPDSKYLVSSSSDGSVRLWSTFDSLDAMQTEALQRVGRWLTEAECQRYIRQETCPPVLP